MDSEVPTPGTDNAKLTLEEDNIQIVVDDNGTGEAIDQ